MIPIPHIKYDAYWLATFINISQTNNLYHSACECCLFIGYHQLYVGSNLLWWQTLNYNQTISHASAYNIYTLHIMFTIVLISHELRKLICSSKVKWHGPFQNMYASQVYIHHYIYFEKNNLLTQYLLYQTNSIFCMSTVLQYLKLSITLTVVSI